MVEITSLVEMLAEHKNHKEQNVYPLLDKNIQEGEKRLIIERMADGKKVLIFYPEKTKKLT